MKKIVLVILCFILVGCSESKISGTYMKIFGPYTGYSSPQIMQYTIKDDKIQEKISTTYAPSLEELNRSMDTPISLETKQFGEKAITVNTFFDENEKMYAGTITIDYSKIDHTSQNLYNVENKTKNRNMIDDIIDFNTYEKMDD